MARLLSILVLLLTPATAAAQVRVSLPLEGYYRPGRYMPVHLVAGNPVSGEVIVSATGALPSVQPGGVGVGSTILPLLMLRAGAGGLTIRGANFSAPATELALRPLADNDRLVGVVGPDAADVAQSLFPNHNVIRIPLDPTNPLPGAAITWSALDAIVAAGPGVPPFSDPQIQETPWRRVGDRWVFVRPDLIGPSGVIVPDAYRPVSGWEPGWPGEVRRQVAVRGALLAIVLVAAVLWRNARAVLLVLAVVGAFMAVAHFWWSGQPRVRAAGGHVWVTGRPLVQDDTWAYEVAIADATREFYVGDGFRPVFASADHAERLGARIECRDGGPLVLRYRLQRGGRLALLRQHVSEPPPEPLIPRTPVTSPLAEVARTLYLTPGARLAGEWWQEPESPGDWPSQEWRRVIVEREDPRPDAERRPPSPSGRGRG